MRLRENARQYGVISCLAVSLQGVIRFFGKKAPDPGRIMKFYRLQSAG